MLDRNGLISRESFFEFAINTKLVDFLEKKEPPTPKKQQMMPPPQRYNSKVKCLNLPSPQHPIGQDDKGYLATYRQNLHDIKDYLAKRKQEQGGAELGQAQP